LTLEQEQEAFDQQVDELLKEHRGEFALFKDGRAVAFFPDHPTAYTEGLKRFGLDSVFLVAPISPPHRQPISLAWTAGVMFGQPG
jgi:hypothetical protein